MRIINTIVLIYFFCIIACASEQVDDALYGKKKQKKEIEYLIKQANTVFAISADTSLMIADRAYKLALKYEFLNEQAEALAIAGKSLLDLNLFEDAIKRLKKSRKSILFFWR